MGILTHLPLQRRIMVLVTAGLGLAILTAAGVASEVIARSTDRVLQERLIMARIQAADLDERLAASLERLQAMAATVTWAQPGVLTASAQRLLASGRGSGLFSDGFIVLDAQRRIVWPTSPSLLLADSEALATLRGGPPMLSGLIRLPPDERPAALLWVPLQDPRGAVLGALGGVIDLRSEALTDLLRPLAFGQTGHAVIIDRNGIVLAGTEAPERFTRGDHPDFFITHLLAGKAHIGRTPEIENGLATEEHVMAFAPLTISGGWGIGFGQATREVFLHERQLQQRVLLAGLLLLLGALWFAWRDTGVITAPLRRLTAAARRIEEGDLDSAISTQPGYEVGMLAAALERMRRHLGDTRDRDQRMAVLEERERIGRDLHDSIMQSLYGISLALEHCQDLVSTHPTQAVDRLEGLITLITEVIGDIRSYVLHLHPAGGTESLQDALERLVQEFRANTLLPIALQTPGPLPYLSPDQRLDVLLLIREALSNVARHAAASCVTVVAEPQDGALRVAVTDDGRGFDADAAGGGGLGLRTMAERTRRLGGAFRLNTAPGGGTRVEVDIPLARERRVIA